MGGHGDDEVTRRNLRNVAAVFCQQLSQRMGQRCFPVFFRSNDCLAQPPFVQPESSSPGKMVFAANASGTGRLILLATSDRTTTPKADRRGEAWESSEAVATNQDIGMGTISRHLAE